MIDAYDAIVAGGGPSGSSVANLLTQKGRRVLVLEREKFPRFHVGESLLPHSNGLWKELGVFEHMDRFYIHKPGARFVHEGTGEHFTYYFDSAIRPGPSYAFHVKRAEFDQMLLDKARAVGAQVEEETRVDEVVIAADGVTVRATGPRGERVATAPVFVDATGRDTLMAGRMGWKRQDELISTNVSLNCMYRGVLREDGLEEGNVIIGLFDGGWYWMIPFVDGDTSVGFVLEKKFTMVNRGLSAKEMYAQILARLPHIARLMKDAQPLFDVFSEANWSYKTTRMYGDRLLLVGDAGGFVDPLFSTGVLLAVNAAKLAAIHVDEALRDGDFSEARFAGYQEACVRETEIFKRLILEFYAENLRRILIASSVNPTICSVIVSILAGDISPPAMWHSIVGKAGFSNVPEAQFKGLDGAFKSSREVLAASKLARG